MYTDWRVDGAQSTTRQKSNARLFRAFDRFGASPSLVLGTFFRLFFFALLFKNALKFLACDTKLSDDEIDHDSSLSVFRVRSETLSVNDVNEEATPPRFAGWCNILNSDNREVSISRSILPCMGIESFIKKKNALQSFPPGDPRIDQLLNQEKQKAHAALRQIAYDSLGATWNIALNTVVRPFVPENGKWDPMGRAHRGAIDSGRQLISVVGSVLKGSGKYAEYRLLKSLK